MYKVTYTIKNKDGYLVDKIEKFDVMQDACKFAREVINQTRNINVVGKPIVEND